MKSMPTFYNILSNIQGARITGSWSPLLKRMLDIIDSFARWSEEIIETLYIEKCGEVDKPFPAVDDILGIYLCENRLFPGSPQGWFIVKARRFQKIQQSANPDFWCLCLFNADVPPIPDMAVPWRGAVDIWKIRDKLTGRPIWIRLTSHEMDGCSYYNLSDWIKAKRVRDDGKSIRLKPMSCSLSAARHSTRPRKKVPITRVPKRRRKAGRTHPFDEYVLASDSDAESRSNTNNSDASDVEFVVPLFPMLTTGKMSSGTSTTATTPQLQPSTSRKLIINADELSSSTDEDIIAATDPSWISLREETRQTLLWALSKKVPGAIEQPWLTELSTKMEEDAIFLKCVLSQDRYEGIARSVEGIIQRFDCLADAVDTLIPVSEETREKLLMFKWNESPQHVDFDPYTH